jgi:hypothetical protein
MLNEGQPYYWGTLYWAPQCLISICTFHLWHCNSLAVIRWSNSHQYVLHRSLGGPWSQSGYAMPGIELQFSGYPPCSLVTVRTLRVRSYSTLSWPERSQFGKQTRIIKWKESCCMLSQMTLRTELALAKCVDQVSDSAGERRVSLWHWSQFFLGYVEFGLKI